MTQAIAAPATNAKIDRYRAAEANLWGHYGLAPTERTIDVTGARLRVLEHGAGEPVLFIGGTGGTGPYWAPLVRELPNVRSLMLDRPGWGLSTPVDYSRQPYGPFVADLMRDALDALGVERAHVVGASIGDLWALRFAQRHPSRTGRVVLLGAGPIVEAKTLPVPAFLRLLSTPVGALIVRLPQKADRVRSILSGLGHGPSLDGGRIPDAFVDWRVAFENETNAMRHERGMVRALVKGRDFRPGVRFDDTELGSITQHVLMVWGGADGSADPEIFRRAISTLPGGSFRLVEGAGHMPWLDDPSGVGAAVREFLAAPD
jgi:pimeloyl-ACP methyl ester carboxylesterase